MTIRLLSILCGLALLGACASAPESSADRSPLRVGASFEESTTPWEAPPLERAARVYDGKTGALIPFEEMLDRLADSDAVFLGEMHIDETTHRVELAIYEGLLERRDGDVVLAMEMFERDVQSALDAYVAGEIDERQFLAESRPWSQYRSAYRPLIERAREGGHPVVASNIPRKITRRIAMEGLDVLESLDAAERRLAPAEIFPNTPAYWRRVDNATRSHAGMMQRPGDEQRLSSTQTLWDNTMGESCALALEDHPGSMVLHINGAFHSLHWDGTVRQFALRSPSAKTLTVDIRSTRNPSVATLGGEAVADFVVMAESRAQDEYAGTWSVSLDRALEYRLHIPESATDSNPAPLLIWLGDSGLTSKDGMDLWRARLGQDVAIAALEPPYRELNDDKSDGGRWFWPDTFSGDTRSVVSATERAWAYILRNYPVDPHRVLIAGEGTGATVASAIALFSRRMDPDVIAFDPSRYAKLKDFPLPISDDGTAPDRESTLVVSGSAEVESWWNDELAAYRGAGLDTRFVRIEDAPLLGRDASQEGALRESLELPAAAAFSAPPIQMIIPADAPRARHWARLHALRHTASTGQPVSLVNAAGAEERASIALSEVVSPETIGAAIPRCPGPFGGTTVLVLPTELTTADKKAWMAIEENDPLSKKSRFHRVRIVEAEDEAGDRSLVRMLQTLKGQGRKNVLIVPAVFYADAEVMRDLEGRTRAVSDTMTLRWTPGLGGAELPVGASAIDPPLGTVDHTLRVLLNPNMNSIEVHDTILLPSAVRHAGAEFTLSSALEILESQPPVESVGVVESDDGASRRRYALVSPSTDGELRLHYSGAINFGLASEKEQYSKGFRATHGIVGPEGVYLSGSSGWIAEFGDEMVRFSIEIESPPDWHVISQGSGTSDAGMTPAGARIARWNSEGDLEQVYLVGGPLEIARETAGSVEALVYLHEMDDALARKYLDATARYIEMYRKLIGPYPYDKFALVENFWETGYGMPSFTLLGEQVIRLPFILHSSYPHEILHNWWGNSVFVDYESGNWCEGLTAYMADHLIQEQRGRGREYRRDTLQKYRSFVKDGRDFPLSEFRSRHSAASEAVGYGKSLMLFHMLRQDVGDDGFRAAMADFYRKNKGERASFSDIQASIDSTTGEDLTLFFDQWVSRAGAPSLALHDVDLAGPSATGVFTVTGAILQEQAAPPFALSTPVVVATESGQESARVDLKSRETRFELEFESRPRAIAVDPSFDVFRLLDPHETPSSIGQVFGEPRVLAILPSRGPVDEYRALMERWRTEDHEIEFMLDSEVDALPSDRGVWLLGRSNRFAADHLKRELTSSMADSIDTVRIGGEQVETVGNSIVVIRRNAANAEEAIGWISVDPIEAFDGFARKLPHYGKYSYLAFEGDEPTNFVKGQWETTDSPLVFEFETGGAASLKVEPRSALAELPPVFSQRKLMEHVDWLAAPEREGRGLGSVGLSDAAVYIAEQFESAGLEPGGEDGTWLQRFEVANGPDGAPVSAMNVVGVLPGARADWREQSIVVGAHYDHLGRGWPDVRSGDEGKIHFGADDNASGVSVLIELARNMASEGGGSRNLVFVAFSGEEAGLLGSRHYVSNPRFPVTGMRGMINLDTVGRLFDGEINVHATGTADEWQHIFRGVGFVTGVRGKNVAARVGGSDQESFIEAGVPAVQIFTGAHADLHRPSDTPEKIDGAGLVKVATFVKEALSYLIEREAPMNVQIEGVSATQPQQRSSGGGRRVSFGTVPNFEFPGPGVKIDSVVPDSPAAKAGVEAGDILMRIDGAEIRDLRAFSQILKELSPGQEVVAVVNRAGSEISISVRVTAR